MRTGVGTEAVKQTGWSVAICDLNSQIEELKERIEVLAGRIEPLFCPEQPTSGADKVGQPNPPKAKAIMEIDSATYRVMEIKTIINEMIQRIEI
jgi:hypothetical protein